MAVRLPYILFRIQERGEKKAFCLPLSFGKGVEDMSSWNELFQYTLVLVAVFQLGWMAAKATFGPKNKK